MVSVLVVRDRFIQNIYMKYWIILSVFIGMISCIPLKQFQDLENVNQQNEQELAGLESENDRLTVAAKEKQAEIDRLTKKADQLEKDTLRLAKENWILRRRNGELLNQYNDYLNGLAAKNTGDDNAKLLAHLQSLHEELLKREDQLNKSERELELKRQNLLAAQSEVEGLNDELVNRNQRLKELERALSEKDSLMNALRKTVADALTGFSNDELAVHIKNGKVYVSMEEKLLFTSGSYKVSDAGIGALSKIASVLEKHNDINVVVEGHTDDVPYKSSVLLDNWDLSVKRATSVVRILLDHANINPGRITAAGRSKYIPLDDSNTPEARRKNRRTEIILSPNLNQVFDILETN